MDAICKNKMRLKREGVYLNAAQQQHMSACSPICNVGSMFLMRLSEDAGAIHIEGPLAYTSTGQFSYEGYDIASQLTRWRICG